jgi:hypothetical protein
MLFLGFGILNRRARRFQDIATLIRARTARQGQSRPQPPVPGPADFAGAAVGRVLRIPAEPIAVDRHWKLEVASPATVRWFSLPLKALVRSTKRCAVRQRS